MQARIILKQNDDFVEIKQHELIKFIMKGL